MGILKFIPLLTPFLALQAACRPTVEESASTLATRSKCSANSFNLVSNDEGIWPYREYKSSNATSPQFVVHSNSQETSDGLIFLTVENAGIFGYSGIKQPRALMMTTEGDLVWASPEGNTSNFRTQVLHKKPVITYWTGSGAAASNGGAAHGYGTVEILDSNYETIYSVCPELDIVFPSSTNHSCVADVHESYITPSNTIVVTVYNITQADLREVGGPKNGWVYDPLVVEVDLETNKPLFIWSPLEHVPIKTSHVPLLGSGREQSNPYDWFHMNSAQFHKGHFLVNSRQTWTTYYVNRNGSIEWQIDGQSGGDFGSLPPNGHFSWQHHVRIQDISDNQSVLTMFADNNGSPLGHKQSVGLSLTLTLPPNKKNPPKIHTHLVDPTEHLYAYAEGAYSILGENNYFVGYGIRPVFKEFGVSPNGKAYVQQSTQFGYVNDNNTCSSYRTYKQKWNATPETSLDLVIRKAGSKDALKHCAAGSNMRGYVSWNGATDVNMYAIYAGPKKTQLQKIGKITKEGFETEFVVPENAKFVQVAAIENGSEVGKSSIVSV